MMVSGEQRPAFQDIDHNVATNVRYFREQAGLSQDDLAQRMSDRGVGFTQATIWKVESGQRTVKISELAALADALDLRWNQLTMRPEASTPLAQLQSSARTANDAYAALKDAAQNYLEGQIEVLIAVRKAQDAGLDTQPWSNWLEMPAERAVIEARLDWDQEEELLRQRDDHIQAVVRGLAEAGYEPLRPEDLETLGPS